MLAVSSHDLEESPQLKRISTKRLPELNTGRLRCLLLEHCQIISLGRKFFIITDIEIGNTVGINQIISKALYL